jgi:hypothetical protein
MKKFYEIPVVEITVFDVEDVITASAGTVSTNDMDNAELGTLITAIQNDAKYSNVQVGTYGPSCC